MASRLESSGIPGMVNISEDTFKIVNPYFTVEERGLKPAKNKGMLKMYAVSALKPALASYNKGYEPNNEFYKVYEKLK